LSLGRTAVPSNQLTAIVTSNESQFIIFQNRQNLIGSQIAAPRRGTTVRNLITIPRHEE
jgi:hypothetical protein